MAKKLKIDLVGIGVRAGATGAGAFAAVKLNQLHIGKDATTGAIKTVGSLDAKTRGGAKVVLGAAAPILAAMFVKDKTIQSAIEAAGNGMMSIGAVELANGFITDPTKKLAVSGIGRLPQFIGARQLDYTEDYSGGAGSAGSKIV